MVTAERTRIDLAKQRPEFFHAGAKPELVQLGPVQYLTLSGGGVAEDGLEGDFQACAKALYAAAHAIEAIARQEGRGFRVPALQATWSAYHNLGDAPRDLRHVDPTCWRWKLMIMVPDFVDEQLLLAVKAGKDELESVQLETIEEGLCVQVLHVGEYGEEHETMREMRRLMERTGLRACGLQHEVYLSDPDRTAADRLRIIVRQPVRRRQDTAPCPEDEW